MKNTVIPLIACMAGMLFLSISAGAQENPGEVSDQKNVQTIIFETQRIEGKIRRPQLVLIRAEQRPRIEPIMMQKPGNMDAVVNFADESVLENSPYEGAFKFSGRRIINYKP